MRGKAITQIVAASALLRLMVLVACSAVDQFGLRTDTYNNQADIIKCRQFFLNIMGAPCRETLLFSDFSQVTGQSSISGSAAISLPFPTYPSTLGRIYVASPAATVPGTQSFTVANLDTEDFYEGIPSPIPYTSIDYGMEEDFPKMLLFTLLVGRIELLPDESRGAIIDFYNSYYSNDCKKFVAMLPALTGLGLNTETVKSTKSIGAPMSASSLPLTNVSPSCLN